MNKSDITDFTMGKELKIILVEDLPTDAELMENFLKKENFSFQLRTVDTMLDFIRELKEFSPDLILSDYMLPQFTAIEALVISQKYTPDIPFIIVSGAVDDETAVHLMKNGAWDYVRKERLVGIGPAITRALERKKTLDEKGMAIIALKQSEEKYAKAFRSSPVWVTINTLQEGRYLEVNDLFLEVTGYEISEVIKHTASELDLWEDINERANFVNLLRQQGSIYNYEVRFRMKSGEVLSMLTSAELLDIGGEQCIIAVTLDISESKKLTEQLLHAQKMEAIGQLAGGVAHDFNNLLNAIVNYASIIRKQSPDNIMITKEADQIIDISMKGSDITRGLLAFSRKNVSKRVPMRLNESIENIEKLLSKFIHENIQLSIKLTNADPAIMADSVQIDQIIINLATNARDAMPDGGTLTIETAVETLSEEFWKTHGFGKPGTYAVLTTRDTGTGMDKATKLKIFDPFFTTKEVGEGTGLGLSIIYGIVKDQGGFVAVDSEEGKGSTFTIYLPVIENIVRKKKIEKKIDLTGNAETILFADDEESIRLSTKTILSDYGYNVIDAVNGRDAVDKFIKNKDKINLVILDAVMPEKSGKDTYLEISKIRPGIKAIFTSGYLAGSISNKGDLCEKGEFLIKPVMPDLLLRKIKSALSS